VEVGKAGGGICYGYRVVRTMTRTTVSTGEREIEPVEAAVVERIFREFVAGHSPKQVAKTLNQQGVAGPFGGKWSPSTLYGHAKRGTGILNNELYIGRMVWNRLRYVKNPDTVSRRIRLTASEAVRSRVFDSRSSAYSRAPIRRSAARGLQQPPWRHGARCARITRRRTRPNPGRAARTSKVVTPAQVPDSAPARQSTVYPTQMRVRRASE
jgi:Recombinase